MKKPIIPKLISFKKPSKLIKKFKLLQQYNYAYVQDYQFSPSGTPLIHYHRKPFKKRNYRGICSIFFMCQCLGRLRAEGGGHRDYPILDALPAIEDAVARELSEFYDSGGEEDSVDERAERFIERFYEEMRMQKQESLMQLKEC